MKFVLQNQAGWKHSLQRHPGNKPGDGGQQQEVEVSSKYQRRGRGGISRLHLHLCVWQQFIGQRFDAVSCAEKAFPGAHPPPSAGCASDRGCGRSRAVCVEKGQRWSQKLCRHPAPRLRGFHLVPAVLLLCLFTLFIF